MSAIPTDVTEDTSGQPEGHCATSPPVHKELPTGLLDDRQSFIIYLDKMWANGTVLHYSFVKGETDQQKAVIKAFDEWKNLGIGLNFKQVSALSEAEFRISFVQGDGSWSYVGRDALKVPQNRATMNFGWSLTTPYGYTTALHEIGHALGRPHEHQNPFSGIKWNETKVYEYFTGPPNNWPREQVFHNVLRQLDPAEVQGSDWDPDSIMEYWFPKGLIVEPAKYAEGLKPAGTLSDLDIQWTKQIYPSLESEDPTLNPFASHALSLKPAEQANFTVSPPETREYDFSTFGESDTVLVLFEEVNGEYRYLIGDDDSGENRNAHFRTKLFAGKNYKLRVRMYWAGASGKTAIMYW